LGDDKIFTNGDGTIESPYMIASAVQLRNFARSVNSGTDYANEYIKILKNIDVSGSEWVPIGSIEIWNGCFNMSKSVTI